MKKELINSINIEKKEIVKVLLRVDKETLSYYKKQGKGHLTLMQDVLKEYAKKDR